VVALAYALEHEPLAYAEDGTVSVHLAPLIPLLAGAAWCGFVYHRSGNLAVTIAAQILVNAFFVWLRLSSSSVS